MTTGRNLTQYQAGGTVDATEGAPSVALSREPTTMDLMRMALAQGPEGITALERLAALKEREDARSARAAFFEAMTGFRAECPPIPKTRTNAQFQVNRNGVKQPAKYAALETIDLVARPVAARFGLAWTWNTRVNKAGMMRVTCRVSHVEGHFEETSVTMPCESSAGSSAQQKYGSAQTYGMRYSLVAALGLTTADEDTDGAAPRGRAQPDGPEFLTDEQVANLDDLIEELGVDKAGFLKYARVGSLSEIRAEFYDRAVADIRAAGEARRARA